jgi:hypothetical protein
MITRNMNRFYKAVFILMILASNCSKAKELPIDSSNGDDLLVVNSILSPDTIISLNLTKSVSLNTPDKYLYLMNADINVYEDHSFLCSLNYEDKGNYIAPGIKPKPGKRYQIVVNEPGYEIITAETDVNTAPDVIGVDTVSYINEVGRFTMISIDYKASVGNCCYYFLNVLKSENPGDGDGPELNIYQPSFGKIDVLKGGLFMDNGATTGTQSIFFSVKYEDIGTGIHLAFSKISKEYFKHILSYCNYLQNKLEWNNLTEPIPVYSNINGGLGMFGSSSSWSEIIHFNFK